MALRVEAALNVAHWNPSVRALHGESSTGLALLLGMTVERVEIIQPGRARASRLPVCFPDRASES